jgi:hypothetical protein
MRGANLNAALCSQIMAAIRAGGYPHVAAEACGVAKDVFEDWLHRGALKTAREPCRRLACGVREAAAQARLAAEIDGHKNDPKTWLIHGPGRENEQRPGWSASVRPAVIATATGHVIDDAEIMSVCHVVLNVLVAYPEARREVGEALRKHGMKLRMEKFDGQKSL